MLSDSVGGSMEGLRFKKMPSVARDGDMEGLRIKRPSVEKRRKPKHGDEVKEEEHVDVGKSMGKEDRRKRKHDDDDQVKEEPAAEGGKSRSKKGKRHDDQLKEEVGDMEALWVKRPSHAGYMGHLSFRCSVNTARRKQEEKRKKRIEELRALDTGSSKEEKGGKRKSPPPPPLMEPFLSYEVSDYMLYEPERRLLELDPNFDVDRFIPDPDLAAKFIASLKKSSAILADRLRQFRLNGYATFFPSWELTDDEKE